MLNTLRRVTSEGTSKIFKFFDLRLEGSPTSFKKRQNKLGALRGAVLTSKGDLVEIFH